MERIFTLTCPPQVGTSYLVPCVQHNGDHWPVLGPPHSDPVLGYYAGMRHIHIDMRFVYEDAFRREFQREISDAYPGEGLNPDHKLLFSLRADDVGPIEERSRECLRAGPDYGRPVRTFLGAKVLIIAGDGVQSYARFEDMHEDKKLTADGVDCLRCPHHGTPLGSMPIKDGIVTCPSHMLDWSVRTGRLVRRTKWHGDVARHRTIEERGTS